MNKILATNELIYLIRQYKFKMEKKKVYISGKITGIENEALMLFEKTEIELRKLGFDVINPMKLPHDHNKTWSEYMKEDIIEMLKCDYICYLENWKKSRGAWLEHEIAEAIGMEVIELSKVKVAKSN